MEEKTLRLEIQHLLRASGLWDYHPPDDTPVATGAQIVQILKAFGADNSKYGVVRNILQPPTWRREAVSMARPDIFGLNPVERTIVIEVKMMDPKKKVEPWIHPKMISNGQRQWLDNWVFRSGGAGFIGIGTADAPRQAWIVPWEDWVKMENELHILVDDFHIKVSNIPVAYELTRVTGGWEFPAFHPVLMYASEDASPAKFKTWTEEIHSLRFEDKKKGAK